jgi:hypothetical protein
VTRRQKGAPLVTRIGSGDGRPGHRSVSDPSAVVLALPLLAGCSATEVASEVAVASTAAPASP